MSVNPQLTFSHADHEAVHSDHNHERDEAEVLKACERLARCEQVVLQQVHAEVQHDHAGDHARLIFGWQCDSVTVGKQRRSGGQKTPLNRAINEYIDTGH